MLTQSLGEVPSHHSCDQRFQFLSTPNGREPTAQSRLFHRLAQDSEYLVWRQHLGFNFMSTSVGKFIELCLTIAKNRIVNGS
jgi:hypothetical protein